MQLHIANATIHIGPPANNMEQFAFVRCEPEVQPILTPPAMGEYWPGQGGRFVCTMPALLGLPARHLIVGEGEADDLTYGPDIDVPGAASHIDGAANTAALLATGQDHPAATWASQYTADGHTDFHLGSRLDMLMAYICTPQLFKKSGWYRTSTQLSRNSAIAQYFEGGTSYWVYKYDEFRVRPVRVIPLQNFNA